MEYFKDGKIYNKTEVRKAVYPATLPKNWGPEHVESKGFLPVIETPRPSITNLQVVSDDGIQIVDGEATRVWTVSNKFATQEEETAYLEQLEVDRLAAEEAMAIAEAEAAEQAEKDALKKQSDQAIAALHEIDLKSIRSLREYIAAQPDAPKWLKGYETEAIAEREKIIMETE